MNFFPQLAISILLVASFSASAALFDRGNGMIYDDVLDVTWLQDVNYAKSSGYDANGFMDWNESTTWAESLSYGGYNDWRLPSVSPINGVSFQIDWSNGDPYEGSLDGGYNVGQVGSASEGFIGSELAYMFYVNFGASAALNVDGTFNSSNGVANATNQSNVALFDNLGQLRYVWFGLEYPSIVGAWSFDFYYRPGFQDPIGQSIEGGAWAVRDGDVISSVPIPTAAWLFGSALVGLVCVKRKG